MKAVRTIALNTFREIIRDRILYGIVVFALLLFGISLALGQLSFAEQARISANFGFTGIQMSAAILAIFAGSTLVGREIEKQTVLTLLARPVSRTQFLVGKFCGLILVEIFVIAGLSVVLAALLFFLGFGVGASFVVALLGVFLEAVLLTSVTLLFGAFARPIMCVVFAVSMYLIGHWIDSLEFFVKKSESPAFQLLAGAVAKVMPNLEKFNWRSAPIYQTPVPAQELLTAVGYAAGWILLLMALTSILFRRRDFV